MDIIVKLEVPAEYFFNRLVESALYDINEQTGKGISAQQLAHFAYKKKLANGAYGRFLVTDYRPDGLYAYSMRTGRNTYSVSYNVTKVGDTTAQLHYIEQVAGTNSTVNANNKLTGFMLRWFRKRRFKKMAAEISQDYAKQLNVSQG